MRNRITQFDWSRHWSKKVVQYLQDKAVRRALCSGLKRYDSNYKDGVPPFILGSIPCDERRVIEGRVSWYQPYGRCHYIAPFARAIGEKLYPQYRWGFLTSEKHTIAIGMDGQEIRIVMDILLFRQYSAEDSISFVKEDASWKMCFTIKELFQPA